METTGNWYLPAKFGIYLTLSYEGHNINPVTDRYKDGCGCFSNGRMPEDINDLADSFDVPGFLRDCEEMRIEYVNMTLYHAHLYTLCPNSTLERALPGHTSRRDVVREILDGLHRLGIKLQLYIHATVGDTMTDEERDILGYNDGDDRFKRWNDFFNDFFGELCARYPDMDSYYIDMIFDEPFLDMIDMPRLRETLKKNNPGVVIVGNGEANDAVDYGSREDCSVYIPRLEARRIYCTQTVILLSTAWWSTVPVSHPPTAKYAPEYLYRCLVMTAGANTRGGGLALGSGIYCDNGFEPGVKETITALGRLVEPVAESIKNTYPSTSYVTPSGITISELAHGIAATRSVCDRYEYIHVLTPPDGNTLLLPSPLDGKRFSAASVLSSGDQTVALTQNERGVTLTLSGKWDELDTVIKLAVCERDQVAAANRRFTVDRAQIKAYSESGLQGHGCGNLFDGRPDTFWLTDKGTLHSVTLDLGDVYTVDGIRVLPHQDGCTKKELSTHISMYSVYASADGHDFRAVATGEWKRSMMEKSARFSPVRARFITLTAGPDWLIHTNNGAVVSASEIHIDAIT